MTIGIYQILNKTNGKLYIGSAVDIGKRIGSHKACLRRNKHANKYLQASYNKYQEDNFDFNLIVECSKENLAFYEDLIIKGYRSNEKEFGYNLREVANTNRGRRDKSKIGLPDQKFNRLTVIKEIDNKLWLVKCDCGKECIKGSTAVRKGYTKSCGCLHSERTSEATLKRLLNTRASSPGDKHNFITLIEPLGTNSNGTRLWKCQCDCGKIFITTSGSVRYGNRKSCGCHSKYSHFHKSGG